MVCESNAAPGIRNVTRVARNHMEMKLRHGLAGSGAIVQTKIEGIGR